MATLRELIGWHLGNVQPITDLDWEILRLVPPGAVLFLAGEKIQQQDIERILTINPRCNIFVRQYLDPNRIAPPDRRDQPDYSCIPTYIDDCRRTMDAWSWLPVSQKHLQVYNEQNMPRRSQWEGFGDWPSDMTRFNQVFCQTYQALKAHDPSWSIGFTPLTPGNRDAYFLTDSGSVPYYMHGSAAAKDNPNEQDIRQGILTGPCREALELCDEYLCHIYCNDPVKEPIEALWGGLRFVRYAQFFPKDMTIWITECGVTNYGQIGQLEGEKLMRWYKLLTQYPQVRGTMLWALGTNLGGIWYQDGRPRPEIYRLKELLESDPPAAQPPVPPQEPPVVTPPAVVQAPGVQYRTATSPNHSDRQGYRIGHIVMHDPEGSRDATLATIADAAAGVSYHDVVDEAGVVYHAVDYRRAAWHCGGSHIDGVPDGKLNGTSYTNLVSIGVSMVYPAAPASPPWPAAQLAATVLHVRELCRVYGLPRDAIRIRRHGDIDPARRSDPRNLDWLWFLAQVAADGPVGLSTGWPHDEPATEPGQLQEKIRWWTEQAIREREAGFARGHAILLDLVDRQGGLMCRLERTLKG